MDNLVILKAVNGKPEPLSSEEVLDFGAVDVSIGGEFKFFLKNPSLNLVADITGLDTVNSNSSLEAPAEIQPGETVKVSIKVHPMEDFSLDNFDFRAASLSNFEQLVGKITWKKFQSVFI